MQRHRSAGGGRLGPVILSSLLHHMPEVTESTPVRSRGRVRSAAIRSDVVHELTSPPLPSAVASLDFLGACSHRELTVSRSSIARPPGIPCGRWRPHGPQASACRQPSGKSQESLAGGLATWYQGIVNRLEQAAPNVGSINQELIASGIFRAMPALTSGCIRRIHCPMTIKRDASCSGEEMGCDASNCCTLSAFSQLRTKASTASAWREDGDEGGREKSHTCSQGHGLALYRPLLCNASQQVSRALLFGVAHGWAALTGGGTDVTEQRANACGLLASFLAPFALPGGSFFASTAGGPAMAFCPIDLSSIGNMKGLSLAKCAPFQDLTMKDLERGLLVATFVQGSLGLVRICLGDVFSGSYSLLLATLGFNSRRPGPASNWLKTYVLITFINGTMSGIDLIQQCLLHNYPVVLAALPLKVNVAHMVSLTVPFASFLGAYCGWQHYLLQKKEAIKAYQEQVLMLMEQPPWPPPPLPFPLPGLPGIQMVDNGSQQAGYRQVVSSGGPVGGRLSSVPEGEEAEQPGEKKQGNEAQTTACGSGCGSSCGTQCC